MGQRPTIRRRSLAATAALLSAVVAAVLVSLGSQQVQAERAADVKAAERAIEALQRVSIAIRDAYAHQAHTIILGNRTHLDHYAHAYDDATRALQTARAVLPTDNATALDAIRSDLIALDENFERALLPLLASGDPKLGVAHDRALQLLEDAQQRVDGLAREIEGISERAEEAAERTARWTFALQVVVLALAVATTAAVAWSIDRSITLPLLALEAAAGRLAAGELHARATPISDDEIGSLARRMNQMAEELDLRQRRLIESEKLAGVGRLAAGVAHEINNPLGVILGYARLIERRPDDALKKDARVILDEVARCQAIVSGLLDLARPTRLDTAQLDLAELTRQVVERTGEARIRVNTTGDVRAVVDDGKVRQIVQNLVRNAVEASPEGAIDVDVNGKDPAAVRIRVQDRGPGVDPAVRASLFEPFSTTKPNGTGLGLAVSAAIARAHGGSLALIDGAPGATFELVLPRGSEPRDKREART